ncbi:MAG: hypothetical protein WB607_24880 [Candidatus Acidiferrum sp.]
MYSYLENTHLDNAVSGRRARSSEPDFIYTQVGESVQSEDGTIEHSEPVVHAFRNGVSLEPRKLDSSNFDCPVNRVTPEAARNFEIQCQAARATIPDFDEITKAEGQLQLPVAAAAMIAGGLHNGAAVAYYLAKHPAEAERINILNETNPRGVQARMMELSAALATDENAGIDRKSYRDFARIRNRQARENFRG